MSQCRIDQIGQTRNNRVWAQTVVTEAKGEDRQNSILLKQDGKEIEVEATAMFVLIGATPFTEWLGNDIRRDSYGFILSGADVTRYGANNIGWKLERAPYLLETSVPGVFVAGDVRNGSVNRLASAVGEGSAIVMFAHQYLSTE
jgi:thioredoxin reductase (NADPH)